MKKWEASCFILVVIVFSAIIASFASRITSLENQNVSLQTQIDQKDLQIASLQTEKSGLQSNITSLQGQITTLQTQTALLQTEKLTMETQITSLETQIAELQSQVQQGPIREILGVYFSPNGGCEDQILYWIDRANSSIEILIYSFTLDSIGDALVEAHGRGVEVQVVFEVGQIIQSSEYWKLKEAGIDVRNDTNSGYMHDKIMIIDGVIVLTGSFNYSENAEETNNENLLVINSTIIATTYEDEFTKIWDESEAEEEETPPQTTDVKIIYVSGISEYVAIKNNGTEDVDMTDWTLKDQANHIFNFPSFVLEAGKTVTVHTGHGTNTDTNLYWGRSDYVWNNDHDTAYLYDANENLVYIYSY